MSSVLCSGGPLTAREVNNLKFRSDLLDLIVSPPTLFIALKSFPSFDVKDKDRVRAGAKFIRSRRCDAPSHVTKHDKIHQFRRFLHGDLEQVLHNDTSLRILDYLQRLLRLLLVILRAVIVQKRLKPLPILPASVGENCLDVLSESGACHAVILAILLLLDLLLVIGVVFQICQEVMNLLVVDFEVAYSHVILDIALFFVHLIKKVLNCQVTDAQVLQPLEFLLIGFECRILTQSVLVSRKLPEHRMRLSRASLSVRKASYIVPFQKLGDQRL